MLGETKRKLLSFTPASWTELKEELKISEPALLNHLNDLKELGLIAKESGKYELTDDGRAALEEAGVVGFSRGSMAAAESLTGKKDVKAKDMVVRGLRAHGSAMDLEKERSALELVASAGLLPLKDIFRTYKPDSAGQKYLDFLADLYVHSVREFLGEAGVNLSFEELRAAWLVVTPTAWREVDKRGEGLVFDYPKAWKGLKRGLSPELEQKMEDRGLDRRRVFRRLRLFSLPTLERIRYSRNDPKRIVDPPTEEKGGEKTDD